jgi:hypothetical protein
VSITSERRSWVDEDDEGDFTDGEDTEDLMVTALTNPDEVLKEV